MLAGVTETTRLTPEHYSQMTSSMCTRRCWHAPSAPSPPAERSFSMLCFPAQASAGQQNASHGARMQASAGFGWRPIREHSRRALLHAETMLPTQPRMSLMRSSVGISETWNGPASMRREVLRKFMPG